MTLRTAWAHGWRRSLAPCQRVPSTDWTRHSQILGKKQAKTSLTEDLPNRRVASNWLEKVLMVQQHFDCMHNLAAGVFGKRTPAARIQRLISKFVRNLLDSKKQHGQAGVIARDLSRCL